MSEQIKTPFSPEDLERLNREKEAIRLSPEGKDLSEKEVVKRSLISAFSEESTVPLSQKENIPGVPDYLANPSPEIKNKLARLKEISREKGIEKAVKEAEKDSPFILDAFHDSLAEEIMKESSKS